MSTTKTQTTTIQLWPAGKSVTYSGSYPHYFIHEQGKRKRKATEAENKSIQANELAKNYQQNEIFCCDSSLVDELIREGREGFDVDDIENVYLDTEDMTLSELRDYVENDMSEDTAGLVNPWDMSRAELVEALTGVGIDVSDDESDDTLRDAVIANIDDETIDGLDDWKDKARELSQDNPREAYEWYRVSQWLCNKLRGIGEIVIDNGYGEWWGRTCTGQALIMDGTLQRIAYGFLNDE